jgi:hypothetical protein
MITYDTLNGILENAFSNASTDVGNDAFKKILDSTFEELVNKSKKYLVQYHKLKTQVMINIGTLQENGSYLTPNGVIHDKHKKDVFRYEYWDEEEYQDFKKFKENIDKDETDNSNTNPNRI